MKKIRASFCLIFIILFACSPKKNTWTSRAYQGFAVKYNVGFNAVNSFNEAQNALILANTDDYSDVLPLYPTVNKETTSSISSQLNTTIEKCRKAIKLHSIRSKPTSKPMGMSDKEFRAYREQEEFNPQIPKAWLLMGKAEYYKADFVEAIATFNYILRHYPENPNILYGAQLWKLRTYTDMGWLHEAESHFSQIKSSNIPTSLRPTYMAFAANLMLNLKRYSEAIGYLEDAIDKSQNKYEKARFGFVLAQLYEREKNNDKARQYYIEAQRLATNYEMIFNARLRAAALERNTKKSLKTLQRMALSSNNKTYLDQIYYAIGNKYLEDNKLDKAIESYKTAMAKSTRNGIDKAQVALRIAELYYDKKEYILSGLYYDSVIVIMPNTHKEYKKAENRSQTLSELAQNYNTVQLQDSLLRLSAMPEAAQRKIIDEIIKKLIEADKKRAKDSTDRAALEVADKASGISFDPLSSNMIGRGSNEWYFYNTSSLKQGKADFKKRWGNRPLEDSWNRLVKTPTANNIEGSEASNKTDTNITTAKDSTTQDKYSPEYYLAQIPATEQSKQIANQLIATALYNMGNIFYTKMNDINSADSTYRTFQSRFPTDERKAETYFIEYQINGKLNLPDEQEVFRRKLLTEYPTSKYAVILADTNYANNVRKMLLVQDSLYRTTYEAYIGGKLQKVRDNYASMNQQFPMSEHLPKFAFLDALSAAKLGLKDTMESRLDTIISKYPDSEVTPISKDILALVRQGRKQQAATQVTENINERRSQEAKNEIDSIKKDVEKFSSNIAERHNILLIPTKADKKIMNDMLYDLAAYNFNKFMVKDFDFDILKLGRKEILVISGMDSLDEGNWYKRLIETDSNFAGKNLLINFDIVIISDTNLSQIKTEENLSNYLRFNSTNK